MNRLSLTKRVQIMAALSEGVGINAVCRLTGVAKHTVLDLLADLGTACERYQEVAIFFMCYNFVKIHQTLRITPAMAAGVATHVWSLEEVVRLLD